MASTRAKEQEIAQRIAERYGATYRPGKGPDIVTPDLVIEVKSGEAIERGRQQLSRYKHKAGYLAVVDDQSIQRAIALTKGSGIGVMDSNGNIRKHATYVVRPSTGEAIRRTLGITTSDNAAVKKGITELRKKKSTPSKARKAKRMAR